VLLRKAFLLQAVEIVVVDQLSAPQVSFRDTRIMQTLNSAMRTVQQQPVSRTAAARSVVDCCWSMYAFFFLEVFTDLLHRDRTRRCSRALPSVAKVSLARPVAVAAAAAEVCVGYQSVTEQQL
jgi:hypothetical protein